MLKLTFYGGAGTVTGSNFLIEGKKGRLLVDCGLEQGKDVNETATYAPFPYDVPSIDALVITHAHLDHIGRAPKLIREGFRGKVYMTEATRDLTEVMLRDGVSILAQEAKERGFPPLYEDPHVTELLSRVELLEYHEEREAAPGLSVYLRNTGHILGSASVRVKDLADGTTLAITGDIGNSPSPYLPDWEPVTDADALVMESVYGDRTHTHLDSRTEEFRDALKRAIARGGTILIPAFSIERTQLMLYQLSNLFEAGEIPQIPVFLDSPLAIKVTEIYETHSEYFNTAAQEEEKKEESIFRFPFLMFTPSREESHDIDHEKSPKIIMAGAGMSHGGRIGRHEARYLGDPATTLFIVGYQAPGTPGRALQDGSKRVRIDGRPIKVRAKVESLTAWSAHADRDGLVKFAEASMPSTKAIFVAIGEPASQRFLAQRLHDYLGAKSIVPHLGETWNIGRNSVIKEHTA